MKKLDIEIFLYMIITIKMIKAQKSQLKIILKEVLLIIVKKNQSTKTKIDPYKDCYSRNNKNYDWLSFFGVDGFLKLNINQ